ncbi:MAG: hypothetical protein HY731_09310 [Candidatus Tectomicrobia bacterium]|nr:hypothetical protein [Candidatus Tectomicrobia bacterium]
MERRLLSYFLSILFLGIVVGIGSNFYLNATAKEEIRASLNHLLSAAKKGDIEGYLDTLFPLEARIYKDTSEEEMKKQEAEMRKIFEKLQETSFSLKNLSFQRIQERIAALVTARLGGVDSQDPIALQLLFVHEKDQEDRERWVLRQLFHNVEWADMIRELKSSVKREREKRNAIDANIKRRIETSLKKMIELLNQGDREAFLQWIASLKTDETEQIFEELSGNQLTLLRVYYLEIYQRKGSIISARFQSGGDQGAIIQKDLLFIQHIDEMLSLEWIPLGFVKGDEKEKLKREVEKEIAGRKEILLKAQRRER